MSVAAQIRQMDKEAEEAAKAEMQKEQPPQPLSNPDGTPTREGWRKIGEMFQKPLAHKQRKGPGGMTFDYVTARQVAERLDRVIGPGNWQTTFQVLDLEKHVVQCTLSVFSVIKADVGYPNEPDSDREKEPLKAAYSDAFKRAAVQFGIGRYLYGD